MSEVKILISSINNIEDFIGGEGDRLHTNACKHRNLRRAPKKIQEYMWPAVYKNNSVVAVGVEGSGKSLGYILPMVRMLETRADFPKPFNQVCDTLHHDSQTRYSYSRKKVFEKNSSKSLITQTFGKTFSILLIPEMIDFAKKTRTD